MEIHDLILADYAEANLGGKFTLVGAGVTEIFAHKVPCNHALMFLFLRIKITRRDIGKNKIQIRLMGEKGKLFGAEVNLDVKPEHTKEEFAPVVIRMVNTQFETYGEYQIQVEVNGEEELTQILTVKPVLAEQKATP